MHNDPLNILPSGSPSIEILNIEFRINGKISLKNTFYQTCSEYGPDGKNNYAFLHPKWEKGVTKGSEVGVSCRRNRYVLWPVLVGWWWCVLRLLAIMIFCSELSSSIRMSWKEEYLLTMTLMVKCGKVLVTVRLISENYTNM